MMRLEERDRYWVLLAPHKGFAQRDELNDRVRPSGRAKRQARLPGRNPANLSPPRQNCINNNSVLLCRGWIA